MTGLESNVGLLLFILAVCLAYPYVKRFVEWFRHRYAIMKRCQYRRDALRTNLRLYKNTGEEYYIERVMELGRK
jgi:hypothetical protein